MENTRKLPAGRFSNDDFERLRFFKNGHSAPFSIPFSDRPGEGGMRGDFRFDKSVVDANDFLGAIAIDMKCDFSRAHRYILSVLKAMAHSLSKKDLIRFSTGLPLIYKGVLLNFISGRLKRKKPYHEEFLELIQFINREQGFNDFTSPSHISRALDVVLTQTEHDMDDISREQFIRSWERFWK